MTETNEHILKIIGTANIPEALDYKEYKLELQVEVEKIAKKNNYDGSFDFIYNARQITAEIKLEGGKVLKSKNTRTNSQKMRYAIEMIRIDNDLSAQAGQSRTEEDFYNQAMGAMMANLEKILRDLKVI